MSKSTVTLIGLYNWDNTLFEKLTVPEALDKQTLVDNILLRSGNFEVLYPNPDFCKDAIGVWSRKWSGTIARWVTALSIEYNPLENYDRQEQWTDTGSHQDSKSGQTSDSASGQTSNLASSQTGDTISGSRSGSTSGTTSGTTGSTTTGKVSAYDEADFSNKDQSVVSGTDSSTNSGTTSEESSETRSGTISETNSGTSSETRSGTNSENSNGLTTGEHTGRIHGNIGVTTSQQMLISELDLGFWNIYEKITDLFLTEFVLPIY